MLKLRQIILLAGCPFFFNSIECYKLYPENEQFKFYKDEDLFDIDKKFNV